MNLRHYVGWSNIVQYRNDASVHSICGQRPNNQGRVVRGCVPSANTVVHIAKKNVLSQLCLIMKNYQDQGPDAASNMRSETVGVQVLIRKEAPTAVYKHYSCHCLNLVIASLCALPVVHSTLDKIKSTAYFFTDSPKRKLLSTRLQRRKHIQ